MLDVRGEGAVNESQGGVESEREVLSRDDGEGVWRERARGRRLAGDGGVEELQPRREGLARRQGCDVYLRLTLGLFRHVGLREQAREVEDDAPARVVERRDDLGMRRGRRVGDARGRVRGDVV